ARWARRRSGPRAGAGPCGGGRPPPPRGGRGGAPPFLPPRPPAPPPRGPRAPPPRGPRPAGGPPAGRADGRAPAGGGGGGGDGGAKGRACPAASRSAWSGHSTVSVITPSPPKDRNASVGVATNPPCQNREGHPAVKLLLGLGLTSGGLIQVDFFGARQPDQGLLPSCQPLPRGALRYADLGFFSLRHFQGQGALGVYWLSRAHPQLVVRAGGRRTQALLAFLHGRGPQVDLAWVTVGTKARLSCRPIAWRLPDAAARRRQRKGAEGYRRRAAAAP